MQVIVELLGMLIATAGMFVLLISSVETVTYYIPHYYEHEYAKYEVDKTLSMDMDELVKVTDSMLNYLKDRHDNLDKVEACIDGEYRAFFNEREVAHMVDVKNLFITAIKIRTVLIVFIVIALMSLYLIKASILDVLAGSIIKVSLIWSALLCIIIGIISTDFTRYFILFHHIFFDNDLWMLDPATDRLISLVPEGFFMDTARNIGICYISLILICIAAAYSYLKRSRVGRNNASLGKADADTQS